jgi:hypothetical protein
MAVASGQLHNLGTCPFKSSTLEPSAREQLRQEEQSLMLGIGVIVVTHHAAHMARVQCKAGSAGVGSTNKEAHCKGLKILKGMPGGGHSLPIFLAILGCGTPVLCDEPVEHVEKDSVWLFHADRLVCFMNRFW